MLPRCGKGEKNTYIKACLQQLRHFSPFVASVDGMLGVEATATLKRITSRLATKWKQSYSKTCGYVKSRIAINLVRTTHHYMQGSWVTAHRISVQKRGSTSLGSTSGKQTPDPLPLQQTQTLQNPIPENSSQ